jgi:hypothetical protein
MRTLHGHVTVVRCMLLGMPRKLKPLAPPTGSDDPEESQRFIDMAREIGADEGLKGQKAFDRTFDKVAKSKPTDAMSIKTKSLESGNASANTQCVSDD